MDYSFHITFTDGSNPYYHFPCDKKAHEAALRKWRKNYIMREVKTIGNTVFFEATAKG